jgi:hypothetical protein
MAEIVKSPYIANRDATPVVATDAFLSGGEVRSAQGVVTVSATAATGSTYPLVSVPSNARVKSLRMDNGALGGTATLQVGVYWPTQLPPAIPASLSATASAAISAAFFASAYAASAALTAQDILNQSGNNTPILQGEALWQAVGLASDPHCYLDIVAEIITHPAASSGYLSLNCDYVF